MEYNSVQAKPYSVTGLYLRYPFSDRWSGILNIENLFASDVKEAQTFFESHLPFESQAKENHFTSGNPFTLKVRSSFNFGAMYRSPVPRITHLAPGT